MKGKGLLPSALGLAATACSSPFTHSSIRATFEPSPRPVERTETIAPASTFSLWLGVSMVTTGGLGSGFSMYQAATPAADTTHRSANSPITIRTFCPMVISLLL